VATHGNETTHTMSKVRKHEVFLTDEVMDNIEVVKRHLVSQGMRPTISGSIRYSIMYLAQCLQSEPARGA
jgi:predicted double-glycine peptidase